MATLQRYEYRGTLPGERWQLPKDGVTQTQPQKSSVNGQSSKRQSCREGIRGIQTMISHFPPTSSDGKFPGDQTQIEARRENVYLVYTGFSLERSQAEISGTLHPIDCLAPIFSYTCFFWGGYECSFRSFFQFSAYKLGIDVFLIFVGMFIFLKHLKNLGRWLTIDNLPGHIVDQHFLSKWLSWLFRL